MKFEPLDSRADVGAVRALPGVERCSATEGGYEVALREGADAARVMQSVIAAVPVARIELKRPDPRGRIRLDRRGGGDREAAARGGLAA